jgi:hypothetical protein
MGLSRITEGQSLSVWRYLKMCAGALIFFVPSAASPSNNCDWIFAGTRHSTQLTDNLARTTEQPASAESDLAGGPVGELTPTYVPGTVDTAATLSFPARPCADGFLTRSSRNGPIPF